MRHSLRRLLVTKARLFLLATLYIGTASAALLNVTHETRAQSTAKINVTQRNYDSMRTGWNQHETKLTVANVKSHAFQQLAQIINLDGQIDAQPLLVTGQSIIGHPGVNDVLYVATENNSVYALNAASFCDFRADVSRGWLLGWHAGTLQPLPYTQLNNQFEPDPVIANPTGFFLTSIWMSGSGVAADASGNLFFVTGNSDSSAYGSGPSAPTSYAPPFNVQESVVKLSSIFSLLDYFTPSGPNTGVITLDQRDGEFGSGGVTLLPDQRGSVRHLAVAAGKSGLMYLLNRDNLGLYTANGPDRVLGTFWIGPCWCNQSFFVGADGVGRVVSGGGSNVMIWKLQTTPSITLTAESQSPALYAGQESGFFPTVSSNGTKPGTAIVWVVARPSSEYPPPDSLQQGVPTLYAFDAATGAQLFAAPAGAWPNTLANANIVPVVANGKVYVASYKQLNIFGLAAGAVIASKSTVKSTADVAPQGANGVLYGTIMDIKNSQLVITTKTGRLVRVDASEAMASKMSVPLFVGGHVAVTGTASGSGEVRAEAIARAKPFPNSWPDN